MENEHIKWNEIIHWEALLNEIDTILWNES